MVRLNLLLPTALIAGLISTSSAWAENIALVISNGTYQYGSNERSIDRAHSGLVEAYEARGYRVFGGNNLNRNAMARLVESFEAELDDAELAIVHLAGHTAALGDHGWFLPTDINPGSAADFEFGAVSLDLFAQMLNTHDGRAVMFIGTSGDEVTNIRGVDGSIGAVNAPAGLLVVSGQFARVNAAVTREFLRVDARVSEAVDRSGAALTYEGYISSRLILAPRNARVTVTPPRPPAPLVRTPESIEAALNLTREQRRRVQENLTILGFDTRGIDGVFGRGTRSAIGDWQRSQQLAASGFLSQAEVARLERLGNERRAAQADADRAYWRQTGASGLEEDLNLYLRRYPQGLYADQAKRELALLTRAADDAYWRDTGASGLADDLNRYLRRYPEGLHADEARRMLQRVSTQADQDEWNRARDRDTIEAYQRYLDRYPDGLYKRAATSRIRALGGEAERDTTGRDDAGAAERAAQEAERALGMDGGTKLLIELRLVALGYRPGAPDGVFDRNTREALAAFQRDRNMPATGYVTALTVTALLRGG